MHAYVLIHCCEISILVLKYVKQICNFIQTWLSFRHAFRFGDLPKPQTYEYKKSKNITSCTLAVFAETKSDRTIEMIADCITSNNDVLELPRNKHIRHGYYVCGQILPSGCTKRKKLNTQLIWDTKQFHM